MSEIQFIPIIFALFPIVLGIVGKITILSFPNLRSLGLATIVILGLSLVFAVEAGLSSKYLVLAVLLSGFCVLICQEEKQQDSETIPSSMITLGLALGALLGQGLASRLFLCGLLGYVAFSITRKKNRSFRTTLVLIHIIIAIIFSLGSGLGGDNLRMLAGLFLAVTFLPLAPFHLPFVGAIENAKGTLASFWIVVWLVIGLAELNSIYPSLSSESLFVLGLLSLVSAVYSSLAALGQKQGHLFVAAVTVAHVSLVWGLLNVFPGYPEWGISFGVAVAFVLGGICLAFCILRQRYGWQTIGMLPGLGSPMPRLGTLLVLLVGFTLFLPTLPLFSGLTTMPTGGILGANFIMIFCMFFAVWLGGGWFLLQMLHQSVFGKARKNVPYTDLRGAEVFAVAILLLGAGYSGLLY